MDARPLVRAVVEDLDAGVDVQTVTARFHNALAVTTAHACALAAERAGTGTVVLSGGVFQNRRLLGRTASLRALAAARVAAEGGADA